MNKLVANKEYTDVAVILVNYNSLDYTLNCLDSLQRQTVKGFSIIVVDNASQDPPDSISARYLEVTLIVKETNGGWAGGNNAGIEYALKKGCSKIILLNNDTVVAEKFVERMVSALDARKDYSILGPMIYSMERPGTILTEGVLFNRQGYDGFFEPQNIAVQISEPPNVVKTDIVNGCCLMARREVFDRVGLIDEQYFIICEESDFCLRAAEDGFKCGVITEPLVWHKQSGSIGLPWASTSKYYYNPRNMWRLLKRHAGKTESGRGSIASRLQYLRTIRHMYCIAVEKGFFADAEALIEGVTDALTGKFGPRGDRHNRIVRAIVFFWMSMNALLSRAKGKIR